MCKLFFILGEVTKIVGDLVGIHEVISCSTDPDKNEPCESRKFKKLPNPTITINDIVSSFSLVSPAFPRAIGSGPRPRPGPGPGP